MKETIKTIPVIGLAIISLRTWLRKIRELRAGQRFYRENRALLQKNKLLDGSFASKRCFLLATGTSINSQDLTKLNGEYSFGLNNFFLHPKLKEINPTHHIFPPSHDPLTNEQFTAYFRNGEKRFTDNQKVFTSITDKYLIDKEHPFNKNRKVDYYLLGERKIEKYDNLSLTKPLPKTYTIIHIALNIAISLGFKQIYLLGVDHDWLMHPERVHYHFYDENEDVLYQLGYKPSDGAKFEMWGQLHTYLRLWKIYRGIKKYADSHGIEIYNTSPGSMLDVFPRKKLEDVLREQRT